MTVADSSPLIALARIQSFGLLKVLFGRLCLPPAVFHDVVTRGKQRPGAHEVEAGIQAGWIIVEAPISMLTEASQGMHTGEIEALSIALERNLSLIVDEGPARRRAIALGISWFGTLDILLLAKALGHILTIQSLLDGLRSEGFRMSDQLYLKVLKQAGE